MNNVFSYSIGKNLYINLTNKCTNNCDFCIRNHQDGIEEYYLWLEKEPTAKDIIESIDDIKKYDEVVFCGFGEPLCAYDVMREVGLWAKKNGARTRVNTNGQAKSILGRDISSDIATFIDVINVSLNASDARKYDEVCHSVLGEKAFEEMLDFAKSCVGKCGKVVLSVVDTIGQIEIEKCRKIAESIGAHLRVRELI